MTLSVPIRKYEKILGLCYLLAELFLIPVILSLLNLYLGLPVWALNFVFFCTNFIFVTIIFHHFLIDSFQVVRHAPFRWLLYSGQGLVLYFAGNFLVSLLILQIQPNFSNINDANILQMSEGNMVLMNIGTVILVPVVEETLYRGLIFRGLFDRSRVLAYAVSTICFSLIHVVGYWGQAEPLTLLLCFVQYLPAGLSLAYAYHKSDTIWAPILMHAAINQIGMRIGG